MVESRSLNIVSISKIPPTSLLFFYKLSDQKGNFYHTILPKLKHSLSLTLNHYLPLAGKLTWPQDCDLPVIQYNAGDGVSLTTAETKVDFYYLSGDSFRESAELYSLLPNFPSSTTLIPAMTIQITLFSNQGFSIGYLAHHAIMDGRSISTFLHSWAYFCRKGDVSVLPTELTPSFDRSFIKEQVELEKVYPQGLGPIDPKSKSLTTFGMTSPPTVLGTYKLTRENIDVLKNKAKSDTPVSTFTVTSAYVFICIIKAKKVTADIICISFGADSRLRLDPPLLPTYFGTCLVGSFNGRDTKDFLAQDGIVTAVNVVSESLTILNKGVVEALDKVSSFMSSLAGKSLMVYTISGSPRFEFYKVNFGWGKPIKVDMISIAEGLGFFLSDDRDDNCGIEIGIALEKHETEAFSFLFANGLETR